MAMKMRKNGNPGPGGDTVEWLLGALSAVAVVALIGFLLYQALAVGNLAPEFEVMAGRIEQRGGAYYVEFRALNRGKITAAGATVEGTLMGGDREIETSEVTLDYLPAQSERSGALLFQNDPRTYRLQLAVKGYRNP
jgi:uncharacterized protein (TIGR02588 family)